MLTDILSLLGSPVLSQVGSGQVEGSDSSASSTVQVVMELSGLLSGFLRSVPVCGGGVGGRGVWGNGPSQGGA